MKYKRPLFYKLLSRLQEPRMFIQVIAGPRQTGKTTIALSLHNEMKCPIEYHTADDSTGNTASWIDQIWESLRIRIKLEKKSEAILIMDEIQKISDWSATVKKHWDRDTKDNISIKLVLLGSSRLLIMDGLSESLLGRFELSYAGHWGFAEMQEAFGFSLEEYMWFGGYPGPVNLKNDELRFKEYVKNSIIEPTMIRDILLTTKIDKPALLRQLFDIGVECSTQIISYNKLLGQMQDVGNTTTLAKYLRLLEQAGLLSGLNKYIGNKITLKGSIPKFQVHNTALYSALKRYTFNEIYSNPSKWGYVIENAIGAYLVDQTVTNTNLSLFYWRDNGTEIDFVVLCGDQVIGIEVKSGDSGIPEKAAKKFKDRYPNSKLILVGKQGISHELFLKTKISDLL